MQLREPLGGTAALPPHEELANAITHGLGLLLSVAGTFLILIAARATQPWLAAGSIVYAMTLILVYGVSTLSHIVRQPSSKYQLQVWDQGVIYLLIAGTYTPFICQHTSVPIRLGLLVGIWSVALVGLLSKVLLHHRVLAFQTRSYVWFGWLPALTVIHLQSVTCFAWMAMGGLSYTLGTLFLVRDRRFSFFHATWHLFVLAGSACHYYAILRFVVLADST